MFLNQIMENSDFWMPAMSLRNTVHRSHCAVAQKYAFLSKVYVCNCWKTIYSENSWQEMSANFEGIRAKYAGSPPCMFIPHLFSKLNHPITSKFNISLVFVIAHRLIWLFNQKWPNLCLDCLFNYRHFSPFGTKK